MTFAVDIKKFAEKCGKNADVAVRKVCLDLTSSIILKTPVDTGRARANWQTSIGTPAVGVINYEGDAGSGTQAPNSSGGSVRAIASSLDAVAKATGNIFWITNNLPYIASLEYGLYNAGPNTIGGFSKQAPNGMVRISIRELESALR